MFETNFVADMTSWISTVPPPPPLEEKQEDIAITIKIRPRQVLSPNDKVNLRDHRGIGPRTPSRQFERHRSHSPLASPQPFLKKHVNLRRSLSQESPCITQRKGLRQVKRVETKENTGSDGLKKDFRTRIPRPITPKRGKRVNKVSPPVTPNEKSDQDTPSPRSINRNRRPAPVFTKPPQYGHCSVDPQPSPQIKKLAHLSEEAIMSPKVLPQQGLYREPSILSKMVKARKQASFMHRGFDAIIKPMKKHLPLVNATKFKNVHVKEDAVQDAVKESAEEVVSHPVLDRAKQLIAEEQLIHHWDHLGRPEVDKTHLKNDSILDKRHASRSVRCVIWKPPTGDDKKEKFALKMIMRGKNIKHAANEKDIMLAIDSPWHTKLFNTFKTDNNLYMLMEFASLGSIGSQISWGRGLKQGTPELITFYAACLVNAIDHMHKNGIIHRDIKPDNLLIGDNGYLKVCDYGLSKFLKVGTKTRTFLGTLAYMPPEQLNGSDYDHSVDYWGLGISVYEMCYGVTPFEPTGMLTEKEWRLNLKANIEKTVLRFPDKNIRFSMKLFLKSLLQANVESRLGGDLDIVKIKSHSCFSKLDWNSLNDRTMVPPCSPESYSFLGTVL